MFRVAAKSEEPLNERTRGIKMALMCNLSFVLDIFGKCLGVTCSLYHTDFISHICSLLF